MPTSFTKRKVYGALFDTGAQISMISPKIVSEVQLKTIGDAFVTPVNGEVIQTPRYRVRLDIPKNTTAAMNIRSGSGPPGRLSGADLPSMAKAPSGAWRAAVKARFTFSIRSLCPGGKMALSTGAQISDIFAGEELKQLRLVNGEVIQTL